MNTSGDAAEQVVRMTLEGTEFLVKLSGKGAINAATLIASALKQENKTRGKERLSNMLRSGKPLKVYTFKSENLSKFKECAKEYGVLYTVLKEKDDKDGMFDVLIPVADENKVNRIIQRFKLTAVDTAEIKTSLAKEKMEKASKAEAESKVEEAKEEKTDAPDNDTVHTEADNIEEDNEEISDSVMNGDAEKEAVEKEKPTAELNDDQFAIVMGEKPVTENPTIARQESEKPLPEKSITDEGKPVKEASKSNAEATEKSSTMSSRTQNETNQNENAQSDSLTSQQKSSEYKTPEGKVDISDVIRKKKEARAIKAHQEKAKAEKALTSPSKKSKEER